MLDLICLEDGTFSIIDYGIEDAETCVSPTTFDGDELDTVEYLSERGIPVHVIYSCLRVEQCSTTLHYTSGIIR